MSSPVDVTALISKVLDLAWQQHTVIADNIARAGLPGASRSALDFEDVLLDMAQAYQQGESGALEAIEPGSHVEYDTGESIVIESEMVALTRNALFYQGLLTARGEYTDILSMAISGEAK